MTLFLSLQSLEPLNDAFNFPSSLIKTAQKVRLAKPSRGSANEGADSEEVLWARKCLSRASLVLVWATALSSLRHYHQRTTFSRTYLTSHFPWQMAGVWGPACFIIIGDEHEAPERSVRRMKLWLPAQRGARRQWRSRQHPLRDYTLWFRPQFDWHQIDPQRCFQIALHNLIYMRPMAPMCETW